MLANGRGAASIDSVTDIVSIRDLRVSTVIGVYDWEREIEQALTFAVDMAADVTKAASKDDIKDALDYSAIAHTVKCVVIEGKFQLIESAAERVAQRLMADFGLAWVRVEVVKPIEPRATRPRSPSSGGNGRQGCSREGRETRIRSGWF